MTLLAGAAECRAEDLLTAYRQALATSPSLRSVRAELAARRASLDHARAGLLPNLRAAADVNYNDTNIKGFGEDFAGGPVSNQLFGREIDKTHGGGGYSVRLVQPLIDGQAWSAVSAAGARIEAEKAAVDAVEQELILQVVEAYFGLLEARADQGAVRSRRALLKKTMARAETELDVGSGDIIAVHEARAGLDAVEAALIRADNNVRIARRRLERLTHQPVGRIADVGGFVPRGPEPERVAPWRRAALDHRPVLRETRRHLEAAREQIRFERRARWPDLDVNAGYEYSEGVLLPSTERRQASVGLRLTFPIYEGGAINARVRWAASRAEALQYELADLQDRVALETENAFLNLQNSVPELDAAARSLASARVSFRSTRKGYRLGSRTIVDLLAAIESLEAAERDHQRARYQQLVSRVRLKTAAGVVSGKDVAAVNTLLIKE
jgi:outer membrane protein